MAIKKISSGLEITEHTAAFVHRSQLYFCDKRRPHSTQLGERIRKAVCQPELILHSGCHCLCSTVITNSSADTSHLLHQRLSG